MDSATYLPCLTLLHQLYKLLSVEEGEAVIRNGEYVGMGIFA